MSENEEIPSDDILHILIATDIHLGYLEDDPIRGDDTFETFEEILKIAAGEDVDLILLGGDLFDDAKPTNYCMNRCVDLIKTYCFGDKPVRFATISDQSFNFPTGRVNYEDPNLNVSIPIFTIHGNHDDPIGKKQISPINLLSTSGLINYFGYWKDITNIEIYPISLQKGTTKVCIYGLSHVKDQRLARLFLDDKVTMKQINTDNNRDWFNIFVLHQNRADRGIKNFIPDTAIPDWFDLCIWGHEHDCRIDPIHLNRTEIIQPGSTVATSLSQGESIKKRIGIVHVYRDQFNLDTFELKTVRPFIYNELYLNKQSINSVEQVQAIVNERIEEMLLKASDLQRVLKNPLPLIRLIVKYDNDRYIFNTIKFSQQYYERIANDDIIKFVAIKTKKSSKQRNRHGNAVDIDDGDDYVDDLENIDDYLQKYLTGNDELQILSVNGLNESIKRYINCKDADSIPYIIDYQIKETLKQVKNRQPDEKQLDTILEQLKVIREQNEEDLYNRLLNDPNRPKSTTINTNDDDHSNIDNNVSNDDRVVIVDDDDSGGGGGSVASTSSGKTGKGRGKGSRGGPGSRGKRGNK